MSEVKALTQNLIEKVRAGEKTTEQALRDFNKVTPTQLSTGRIYTQKDINERREKYEKAREIRSKIKKNKIPFITENFLPDFYLCQGLVIVGAESGRAKSTTAANLIAGFLQSSTRNAIIISNEEATDAVYERIACIALKKDYTRYFAGRLSRQEEKQIIEYVIDVITPRVEVVEDGSYDMSYLEDVQAVLESAKNTDNEIGMVLIDYLQIINQSRKNPGFEAYQVSKQLGIYLKNYGVETGVPVVCLAQLHSTDRGSTMAARVQNDKTFFNHGFICIEVVPDFETLTTEFRVHKDRFCGHTGKEISCQFSGGRYIFAGDEDL